MPNFLIVAFKIIFSLCFVLFGLANFVGIFYTGFHLFSNVAGPLFLLTPLLLMMTNCILMSILYVILDRQKVAN